MRKTANFLLFQATWSVAVLGAARGHMWLGPVAALTFLTLHLKMIGGNSERRREASYAVAVGLLGTLADTALYATGATTYPTSEGAWPYLAVPPWITSLWVAFALLPRFSLGWLRLRPGLAALLGAVGGPLSYFGGTRFGAVGVGEPPLLTWASLAVEYAVAMPLLMRFAPSTQRSRVAGQPLRS